MIDTSSAISEGGTIVPSGRDASWKPVCTDADAVAETVNRFHMVGCRGVPSADQAYSPGPELEGWHTVLGASAVFIW